jgi:hypothetical protein
MIFSLFWYRKRPLKRAKRSATPMKRSVFIDDEAAEVDDDGDEDGEEMMDDEKTRDEFINDETDVEEAGDDKTEEAEIDKKEIVDVVDDYEHEWSEDGDAPVQGLSWADVIERANYARAVLNPNGEMLHEPKRAMLTGFGHGEAEYDVTRRLVSFIDSISSLPCIREYDATVHDDDDSELRMRQTQALIWDIMDVVNFVHWTAKWEMLQQSAKGEVGIYSRVLGPRKPWSWERELFEEAERAENEKVDEYMTLLHFFAATLIEEADAAAARKTRRPIDEDDTSVHIGLRRMQLYLKRSGHTSSGERPYDDSSILRDLIPGQLDVASQDAAKLAHEYIASRLSEMAERELTVEEKRVRFSQWARRLQEASEPGQSTVGGSYEDFVLSLAEPHAAWVRQKEMTWLRAAGINGTRASGIAAACEQLFGQYRALYQDAPDASTSRTTYAMQATESGSSRENPVVIDDDDMARGARARRQAAKAKANRRMRVVVVPRLLALTDEEQALLANFAEKYVRALGNENQILVSGARFSSQERESVCSRILEEHVRIAAQDSQVWDFLPYGLRGQVGRICRAWPRIMRELKHGSRAGVKKQQKLITYEPASLARADERHAISSVVHLANKRRREDDSRESTRYKHALSRCIEEKTARGMQASRARAECAKLDEPALARLLEKQEARRAFEKARLENEKMRESCEDYLVERKKLSRESAREKCAIKENLDRYKAYRNRRGLSSELVRVKPDVIERHLKLEEELVAAVRGNEDARRDDRAQRAINRAVMKDRTARLIPP